MEEADAAMASPGTTGRRCARAGRRRPIIRRAQTQRETVRPWKRPMRPWQGPWDNWEEPDSGISQMRRVQQDGPRSHPCLMPGPLPTLPPPDTTMTMTTMMT
eukprot:scaffold395348_cov39-Attheya_sp.AAC.1